MFRPLARLTAGALATFAVAACSESTGTSASSLSPGAFAAALGSVPAGYGDLASSFVGAPASDAMAAGLWIGGGREASFDRRGMMGGGLQDAFAGGVPFQGRGGHRGPFGGPFAGALGCAGTFDAASGRVVCPTVTFNGITVTRSAQYLDAGGTVQQAFDTLTTNTVDTRSQTSGTLTYDQAADGFGGGRGGHRGEHEWGRGRGPGGRLLGDTSTVLTATTTIDGASARTVSGLAQGSTQRTVEGASAGSETTTGTSTRGNFTASRTVGDTTTGLVVPVSADPTQRSYPTAGTTIRSIVATLQYDGESPVTLTRREVVTYDGTDAAKVEITENGSTRNCTKPLPRGPLSCS